MEDVSEMGDRPLSMGALGGLVMVFVSIAEETMLVCSMVNRNSW